MNDAKKIKNNTMIQKVFSVYDNKAGTYSRPMFARMQGEMLRSFTTIANDKKHPVGMYPEDYTLYEIGTFDEQNGEIKPITHKSHGKAIQYVRSEE